MSYGVDLSHHQDPTKVPWDIIASSSEFCIVRSTYGSGLRDRHCASHIRRARKVGLKVGLYHFFRPSQFVEEQILAFRAAARAAEYDVGDIIPALDVEADPIPKPGTDVNPDWEPGVRRMAEAISSDFGGPCMIYITQREFRMLGAPQWLLSHPLWVAHYTGASRPATPGNQPPAIWQHRVGPYDPRGAGGVTNVPDKMQIDQNKSFGTLPVATKVPWGIEPAVVLPPTDEMDNDDDWDELTMQAMEAQVDVVAAIHADGMREMAGLDTQRPEADPEDDPEDGEKEA